MKAIEVIKSVTKNLRTQKDELFVGIGRELANRGFDIQKVVIAAMFTEDSAQYYVVIVTSDKGVFEFYYDFLHRNPSEGTIIDWHDFTENPEMAYMHESVEVALKEIDNL